MLIAERISVVETKVEILKEQMKSIRGWLAKLVFILLTALLGVLANLAISYTEYIQSVNPSEELAPEAKKVTGNKIHTIGKIQ